MPILSFKLALGMPFRKKNISILQKVIFNDVFNIKYGILYAIFKEIFFAFF